MLVRPSVRVLSAETGEPYHMYVHGLVWSQVSESKVCHVLSKGVLNIHSDKVCMASGSADDIVYAALW